MITLLIAAFLIPITTVLLHTIASGLAHPADLQDETAICQLRHVMNVSDNFEICESVMYFDYHDERHRLELKNGNLDLLDPGTVIFLSDLAEVSFSSSSGVIYMTYRHTDEEPVTRCLGHE